MHTEYTALMSLVLDHEATPAEDRHLREHLASCPACSVTWDRWRIVDRRLGAAPMLAAPPGFVAGVMAQLEARERRRSHRTWFGSGLLLIWGVIFCGFWLAVAGLAWWGLSHPLEAGIILSTAAQVVSLASWLLRGVGTVMHTLGRESVLAGLALSLGVTSSLAMLWLWVMARSQDRLRLAVSAEA